MVIQNSQRKLTVEEGNNPKCTENMAEFYAEVAPFVSGVYQNLFIDACNLQPSYGLADSTRDALTCLNRLKHEGLSFATKSLPIFWAGLTGYLENGVSDYPGFKLKRGCAYPLFLGGLTSRIYDHEDDDGQALMIIYQICSSFVKLKGPYPSSVLSKQLAKFVQTDHELGKYNPNSEAVRPIVERARAIVTKIFKDLDVADPGLLRPRPGPGATNTPVEKHMRYEPHVLYTQLNDVFDYHEWFYTTPWEAVEQARTFLRLHKKAQKYPTSRFKFVHKKVGKARGICIEENETQWFQQALKGALYNYIEKHPITAGRICFTDQSVNQKLALVSSVTRSHATIDMEDASDRVSRDLVMSLFRDLPDLLEMLDSCSTRFIKLPRELYKGPPMLVHKYAPMGSGLCFPVMAIVHFALIRAITTMATSVQKKDSEDIYVYGDDIIVPTSLIPAIYDWLPMFGMKLNFNKSFFRSHFRESCGVHAYKGVDITPVYFQYTLKSSTTRKDTTTLLSLVSKESALSKKGFEETASYVRKNATAAYGIIPYVGHSSPVLGWKRDGLTDLKQVLSCSKQVRYVKTGDPYQLRNRSGYQEREYLVQVVVPSIDELPPMDRCEGYLRKLVTNAHEATKVDGSCEDLRIRTRWIPESALCGQHNKIVVAVGRDARVR